MVMIPTRQQMDKAIQALKDRGWIHVASIILKDDRKGSGLLFLKDGGRFWLNKFTIKDLPK
jgi:hypothetical protein